MSREFSTALTPNRIFCLVSPYLCLCILLSTLRFLPYLPFSVYSSKFRIL